MVISFISNDYGVHSFEFLHIRVYECAARYIAIIASTIAFDRLVLQPEVNALEKCSAVVCG